jgi:hypothetical protein
MRSILTHRIVPKDLSENELTHAIAVLAQASEEILNGL